MVLGARTAEERTVLSEGTDSAGGYTTSPFLAGVLIDKLRPLAVCMKAGAKLVVLESNNHAFARVSADPTPSWRAENATIAESEPTFDRVQFLPKSLAVKIKVSRELLQDSININTAIEQCLFGAMAVGLDVAALFGTGSSNQPTGLTGISGVPSISMGTNGAVLDSYDKLVDAVYQMRLGNAADPTGFLMHPRTLNTIDKLKDSQARPLARPASIQDTPFLATTSFPINETQGTASNASRIIAGDFGRLWIGLRSEVRIEVLRETYADNHQYGFVAHLRADIAAEHPESFCQIVGVIP